MTGGTLEAGGELQGKARAEWRTTPLGWVAVVGAIVAVLPRFHGVGAATFAAFDTSTFLDVTLSTAGTLFRHPFTATPLTIGAATVVIGIVAFFCSPREQRDALSLGAACAALAGVLVTFADTIAFAITVGVTLGGAP